MNRPTSTEIIEIRGKPYDSADATWKMMLAAACIGLGILLWPLREHSVWGQLDSDDATLASWIIAISPWIAAPILPYKAHSFLDLGAAQWVTLTYYGWNRVSDRRRPLSDFSCITVRLVSHPSEGAETFTGSVGLKPQQGGAVLWLKEFPSTPDEMPREAIEYARRLKVLLPLPLPIAILGSELLSSIEGEAPPGPTRTPEDAPPSQAPKGPGDSA